jgi:hypothetical protein
MIVVVVVVVVVVVIIVIIIVVVVIDYCWLLYAPFHKHEKLLNIKFSRGGGAS